MVAAGWMSTEKREAPTSRRATALSTALPISWPSLGHLSAISRPSLAGRLKAERGEAVGGAVVARPQVVRHAVQRERVEPLEVEQRLQQPRRRGVDVENLVEVADDAAEQPRRGEGGGHLAPQRRRLGATLPEPGAPQLLDEDGRRRLAQRRARQHCPLAEAARERRAAQRGGLLSQLVKDDGGVLGDGGLTRSQVLLARERRREPARDGRVEEDGGLHPLGLHPDPRRESAEADRRRQPEQSRREYGCHVKNQPREADLSGAAFLLNGVA